MSAIHITNLSGRVACGREAIRGYITREHYKQLAGAGRIRERSKTSVKHSCSKRPCGCPRRKEVRSGVCAECRWRVDQGAE